MSKFFSAHARERFEERYGFRPTIQQLSAIAHAVAGGRAVMVRSSEEGGKAYCCLLNGKKVFPVVSPDGTIITFLPPNFMLSSEAKKHREEQANSVARPPSTRDRGFRRKEPYRRPRTRPDLTGDA